MVRLVLNRDHVDHDPGALTTRPRCRRKFGNRIIKDQTKVINQLINQSIYLFVLCFKTKNTAIYVKKNFFRKHRKAAKWPYGLLVNCLPLNSGTKKKFFFLSEKHSNTLTKTQYI